MIPGSASFSVTGSKSGKRPPKDKGCFQCSRRRIVCDKGEPSCKKCIKKGIECSGLGRIRFAEGVARRGRLKDCKIPDAQSKGNISDRLPDRVAFSEIRWNSGPRKRKRKDGEHAGGEDHLMGTESFSPPIHAQSEHTFEMPVEPEETMGEEEQLGEVFEVIRTHKPGLQPWIPPVNSESRMLFSYFSEAVAPVMVIFDTVPNGYRDLILPMAFEDDVLRRAVGVVAAQRLGHERPEIKAAAEAGRAAIISRLHRESRHRPADQVFSKYTWATLIVLLVGETVTGNVDYSFLIQMLLCVSTSSAATAEDSDLIRFLHGQTSLFKLLGLPLFGEESGLLAMRESFHSWTTFLSSDLLPAESNERCVMDSIRQCFASACAIYIRRASSKDFISKPVSMSGDDPVQRSTIQLLIDRVSKIPPHAPGAHALVWVCFVAAAESNDPAERQFFVDYMDKIYAKTRFDNIPLSVKSLQKIWEHKGKKRWTESLSELTRVLVM